MKKLLLILIICAVASWSAAQTPAAQNNANVPGAANSTSDKESAQSQTDASTGATEQSGADRAGENKAAAGERNQAKKPIGNESVSGQANQPAATGTGQLPAGTAVHAVLGKGVDAKKAKAGQEVIARVANAAKGTASAVIPAGSKLVGHVTEARARANGDSESMLAIVFDKAVLKDGQQVPIRAVIQALGPPAIPATPAFGADTSMGFPREAGPPAADGTTGIGGMTNNSPRAGTAAPSAAGTGSSIGPSMGTTNETAPTPTGTAAAGQLSPNAHGVVGLPGLTLNASTGAGSFSSVITSTGKDVKLDSGTQMVLRVVNQ